MVSCIAIFNVLYGTSQLFEILYLLRNFQTKQFNSKFAFEVPPTHKIPISRNRHQSRCLLPLLRSKIKFTIKTVILITAFQKKDYSTFTNKTFFLNYFSDPKFDLVLVTSLAKLKILLPLITGQLLYKSRVPSSHQLHSKTKINNNRNETVTSQYFIYINY